MLIFNSVERHLALPNRAPLTILNSGDRRLQHVSWIRDVNKEERRMKTTVVDQDIPELNLDKFKELLVSTDPKAQHGPLGMRGTTCRSIPTTDCSFHIPSRR